MEKGLLKFILFLIFVFFLKGVSIALGGEITDHDIHISLSANPEAHSVVRPGDKIVFYCLLENNDDNPLEKVVVRVFLPKGIDFLVPLKNSESIFFNEEIGAVVIYFDLIESNMSRQVTLNAIVRESISYGEVLSCATCAGYRKECIFQVQNWSKAVFHRVCKARSNDDNQ